MSVEIMQSYTKIDHTTIKDLFCNEKGYQTPKVDVRGVVIEDGKILLVKEAIDGKWSLPGGWAEFNLSVKENVVKEVKEEAGIKVTPKRMIAVQDRKYHNKPISAYGIYKVFVLCERIEGGFVENIETEASGYFAIDALPPLSEGRNTEAQIQMCFQAASDAGWEVYYD